MAGQFTPSSTHADAGRLDLGLPHPLAGPVLVEGAEPGDLLEVEFLEIATAARGSTYLHGGFGFLRAEVEEPFLAHSVRVPIQAPDRRALARQQHGRCPPDP
jgi:acetamidase/formamidase